MSELPSPVIAPATVAGRCHLGERAPGRGGGSPSRRRRRTCGPVRCRATRSRAGGPRRGRRGPGPRSGPRSRLRSAANASASASAVARWAYAVLLDPADLEALPLQRGEQLGQRIGHTVSAAGIARRSGAVSGRPSSTVKANRPPGRSAAATAASSASLSPEREQRLEQQHHVERPAGDRRDLGDLEAAGQVPGGAGARPRRRRARGPRRGSGSRSSAVTSRPGPADAAAQVQHRDARTDAGPRGQRPDLAAPS